MALNGDVMGVVVSYLPCDEFFNVDSGKCAYRGDPARFPPLLLSNKGYFFTGLEVFQKRNPEFYARYYADISDQEVVRVIEKIKNLAFIMSHIFSYGGSGERDFRISNAQGRVLSLPPEVTQVFNLTYIEVANCPQLEELQLPSSICELSSLTDITVVDCPQLRSLSDSVCHIPNLRRMDIRKTQITAAPKGLPDSVSFISSLSAWKKCVYFPAELTMKLSDVVFAPIMFICDVEGIQKGVEEWIRHNPFKVSSLFYSCMAYDCYATKTLTPFTQVYLFMVGSYFAYEHLKESTIFQNIHHYIKKADSRMGQAVFSPLIAFHEFIPGFVLIGEGVRMLWKGRFSDYCYEPLGSLFLSLSAVFTAFQSFTRYIPYYERKSKTP